MANILFFGRVGMLGKSLSTKRRHISGPRYPNTVSIDTSVYTITWNNIDNIKNNDGIYSDSDPSASDPNSTRYLKATNFGFSIPNSATIKGILVELGVKSGNAVEAREASVVIIKFDGSYGSTPKGGFVPWPQTDMVLSFGGSTDLWSETWTPARINDADFGVAIRCLLYLTAYALIEFIRIRVYYSL